jgi:hypothetical protein
MLLALATVLSTTLYEGDVPAAGGDYADVAFVVPAGTQEIRIAHSDGSATDILDWGVWSPDGFRGWGGGLTDDAVIAIDQSSRGYLPGPITPGTWTLVIGKALLSAAGGHYTVTVTCADAESLPVLPTAPFSAVVVHPERRWYKGDFHVHSSQSGDASASFDEIALLAKQRGLDFVNLSDHNTSSQHALQAAYLASHPDLLLLRGAEITTYEGHGNAVGLTGYVDHRIGYAGRTITGVLDDVAAQGAIFIVNHPKLDLGNACIGCAWHHADTDWTKVTGLELITGNWEIGVNAFVPQVLAMWDGLLDQGFRIAAIGGSDDHTAGRNEGSTGSPVGSPTTLVLADNLSEAAIVDAVRHGRTIVQLRGPDDPRLDVTLATRAGAAAEIGDDVDGIAHVALAVHVQGGDGTFAQVWRDGVMLDPQRAITGDDATVTFDDVPGAGDFRYRVELVDGGGSRIVVTSHFYVHAVTGGAGCGCGATGDLAPDLASGIASGLVPVLVLLVPWRRRRRARRSAAPPAPCAT